MLAEPARAMDILKWKPKFAELELIVESAWKWHSKH
jgi:UDP-glucose 4-epimerase